MICMDIIDLNKSCLGWVQPNLSRYNSNGHIIISIFNHRKLGALLIGYGLVIGTLRIQNILDSATHFQCYPYCKSKIPYSMCKIGDCFCARLVGHQRGTLFLAWSPFCVRPSILLCFCPAFLPSVPFLGFQKASPKLTAPSTSYLVYIRDTEGYCISSRFGDFRLNAGLWLILSWLFSLQPRIIFLTY